MSDVPRRTLRDLIARHGPGLSSDARRCEGLLRDLCGAHRREINILISALKERVPLDLLAGQRTVPRGLLLARLSKRLEEQLALTAEAARWAVDTWALALGVLTDAEVEERERQHAQATSPPTDTTPRRAGGDEPEKEPRVGRTRDAPNAAAPPPPLPSRQQQQQGRPRPQVPPPSVSPTRPVPPNPSPPVSHTRTGRPVTANRPPSSGPMSPRPTQQFPTPAQDPTPVQRRGRSWRGCTVGCFLLILLSLVLFFGVPFVVSVLREEQQRRNAEPPPAVSQ